MSNLRILEKIEDREYVWNYSAAKDMLESYYSEAKRTVKARKFKIYEEIANRCCVSFDAVKNWFSMKNGPGDLEQVKKIAEYFGIDYMNLLKPLKGATIMTDELFDKVVEAMQEEDNMVNYRTVKFIDMLNRLAEESKKGYVKFSEYQYEGEGLERPGILYVDEQGSDYGRIVLDMCVDEIHHDMICTYESFVPGLRYDVKVLEDEYDGKMYIEVTDDYNMCIVIENGIWYCC